MLDVAGTEDPAAFLDRLDQEATRMETPCGHGTVVWRSWGEGPVLVLFHGGAGSWRHWAHNIDDLSRDHRLLVPDLPGLGESADLPLPHTADAVAAILTGGIDRILGPDATYDLAGFSFGGTASGCLAALHGARVRSLTLICSGGVGPSANQVELLKVRHLAGEARVAAHRTNLNRLMIADPAKIDALALLIQDWNTRHSRLKTPLLSRGGALRTALEAVHVPVNGIWGGLDPPANPRAHDREAALRAIRPDVNFHMIAGAGHWVAYEVPAEFNATLRTMLLRTHP